jgi:hypothetical protein
MSPPRVGTVIHWCQRELRAHVNVIAERTDGVYVPCRARWFSTTAWLGLARLGSARLGDVGGDAWGWDGMVQDRPSQGPRGGKAIADEC